MTQVRETLAGRYELREVLGRGGMGVVHRAIDGVLDRAVAIKVLPGELAADPTFVVRFKREALAAAALNHPNIVAIYDSGRDGDTNYIVMECVPGQSLAKLLAEEGCLASDRAVGIATQIAAALATAHRAGVIHRDIKPANVMVGEDDRVKVLDFGIARAAAHTTLTQPDMILGSAPYLAPEVTKGLPADARSDIYALGCVSYAMLTGEPPFSADVPAAIMHQHVAVAPRPPRELNRSIPPRLEALLLEMLAKDPAARPQRAAQLVKELPASLGAGSAATAPLPTRVMPRPSLLEPRRPRRLTAALLIALGLAAVVAMVALAAGGGSPARRAHRHPATVARAHPSSRRTTTTSHTTRPVSASVTTSSQSSAPAPTVASASASIAALLMRDQASGGIDQQASDQIAGNLRDTLHAYYGGNSADALNHVGALPAQIAQLQGSGDIQASAAGPLDAAAGQLQAALERAAPQSGGGAAAQPTTPTGPPGGGPPGQDKNKPGKPPKDHGNGGGGGGD